METVVSLSILGISLLLIIGLFLSMIAQTDNDGERTQVAGLLEAYQAELKAKPETDWELIVASGLTETRTLLGEPVILNTTAARLSTANTSPDYRVFQLDTVATWQRSGPNGAGQQTSRSRLCSQVSPLGRY